MGNYGAEDAYHYPTELLALLEKCLPLLCPAKRDVFQFFRAAGVDRNIYGDWESQWSREPDSVGKYPIVRDVLNKLNERDTDTALRQRREIIKRVTNWENFTTLWEKDRLPAKGLVAEIRETVHKADSFTLMERERDNILREQRKRDKNNWMLRRKSANSASIYDARLVHCSWKQITRSGGRP